MLDKGRATVAGKNGEFHYDCPLDQHFVSFCWHRPQGAQETTRGRQGRRRILEWIHKNAKHKRTELEIRAWSEYHNQRVPMDSNRASF